jgi:hypothetical protein
LAAPSDDRQFDFNSPFGIIATTDGSCQTTNLELQPIVVSEIPNAKEDKLCEWTGKGKFSKLTS